MKHRSQLLLSLFALAATLFPAPSSRARDFVKGLIEPSDLSPYTTSYVGDWVYFNFQSSKRSLFLFQRPNGRWMVHIEPGTIVAEVEYEKVGQDRYRFSLLDWERVSRVDRVPGVDSVKKALSIQGDHFEVQYEERRSPDLRQPITRIVTKVTEVAAHTSGKTQD